MTAICVPIFVKAGVDLEEEIAAAEEVLEGTRGMIELRCDTGTPKQMLEAIDLARVPVIVTIRPTWENGFSTKSDAERIGMWEAAMEAGAEFIDVEVQAWEKSAKIRDAIEDVLEKAGTRLIISNHDFAGRPADLAGRMGRLRAVKAAGILKMAWKAESILDGIEALRLGAELPKEDRRPVLALAMGEEGVISRLLAKKVGAPLTFATVGTGKESAPGQPTVRELRERYRWDSQKGTTAVFGVAGWPVGHSLSPHIHNAGFEAGGVDGVYVPLAVRERYEDFVGMVEALRGVKALGFEGMSVTIPHKENAFRYVQVKGGEMDELSRKLGVINTVVWRGETMVGLNSDYAGALDALVSAWTGRREDVAGKRVAVIGAGGAARAIVAGLAAHGAMVVVYNRTREKAEALAAEFGGGTGKVVAAAWEELGGSDCAAFINCTPLGMHPKVDASPVEGEAAWTAETVVFDTVYNPLKTKLLKLAEKQGAKTVPGVEMFVRQAAIQFKAFTGKEADVGVFRGILKKALGG